MRFRHFALALMLFAGYEIAARAAQAPTPPGPTPKTIGAGGTATVTATIQAIDATNRLVTLKFDDGTVNTVLAGPEVRRFNELKVGDKVTFRYHESAVLQLHKAGTPAPASSVKEGMERSAGPKPGGTMAQQVTATVTVEAIDPALPSITVKTEDGDRVTYHVEDKKNLEGVTVGDRIEITFTRALMISVSDAK
jgi:Cu/Ag efflux protein CusF